MRKARALAKQHSVPFVPVHHMEAHALTARQARGVPFPYLTLLVSGGHTMLLTVHGVGDYTLLGSTLDDSVGECLVQIVSPSCTYIDEMLCISSRCTASRLSVSLHVLDPPGVGRPHHAAHRLQRGGLYSAGLYPG